MRILWILPYLPWPTTSGGKTRQYHLIRSLAQAGHRITLLVQSKTLADEQTREALEPLLEQLIVLPRRPLRSPLTLISTLLAPYPLLASINGLNGRLRNTFHELLNESWDVIQIEHSYSFQPYEHELRNADAPFIITEHNVESALGAATYDRLPNWLWPFIRFDQWRYRRWEKRVMSQAARVIAVTENDAQILEPLSGRPTTVVVNGVDCAHYANVKPDVNADRLLFIGNYEYAPNVDAIEWALNEILPRLWQRCPQTRFAICGYALPAAWAQRWSDPRIEWHGFVADLRTLQCQASIFFAPLRQGGGSKLKVLEAMAAGLPVVTTYQGVSGLTVQPHKEYALGEDAGSLAETLAELLLDPKQATTMGLAGRAYVTAQHDWAVAAKQLENVYAQLTTSEVPTTCA